MCCNRSVYVFLVSLVLLFVMFGARASALPAVYATSLIIPVGKACASQAYGHGIDPHKGLVCVTPAAIISPPLLLCSINVSVCVCVVASVCLGFSVCVCVCPCVCLRWGFGVLVAWPLGLVA